MEADGRRSGNAIADVNSVIATTFSLQFAVSSASLPLMFERCAAGVKLLHGALGW